MNQFMRSLAFAAVVGSFVPCGALAQAKIPNTVTLVVVEERPRPEAVAVIRIENVAGARIENTITIARNDISRASVYTAIALLNGFRDTYETIQGAAELMLTPDKVPNEHRMTVESRKYVEGYLHQFSKGADGRQKVVIPLRERRPLKEK